MISPFGIEHTEISKGAPKFLLDDLPKAGTKALPHVLGGPKPKTLSTAQKLNQIQARQPAPGKPKLKQVKRNVSRLISGGGTYRSGGTRRY